jgi:hypothetical protein
MRAMPSTGYKDCGIVNISSYPRMKPIIPTMKHPAEINNMQMQIFKILFSCKYYTPRKC